MSFYRRSIPIQHESDWWASRSGYFPSHFHHSMPSPMSLVPAEPSYRYLDPFPVEERRYGEDRQVAAFDSEMRRMNNELNSMVKNMQKLGPLCGQKSVDDFRLTEDFKMSNPIIQDYAGNRKFHLSFDVRQFKPEEIHVKTSGNQLSVHARHEEKESGRSVFREYNRQYVLPKEVNPEHLTSRLSADGVLSIECHLPALPGQHEKLIPIDRK